jgi:hypothetical protein
MDGGSCGALNCPIESAQGRTFPLVAGRIAGIRRDDETGALTSPKAIGLTPAFGAPGWQRR